MRVHIHTGSSAILGGTIYAVTQSAPMAISAFVSGVLIDLDHIFDYLFFADERFSVKKFFSYFGDTRWEKVTILFHSYELFLVLSILAFFYPNDILYGVLLGGGLHLMLDQIGVFNFDFRINAKPSPMYYFLTYRYLVSFHKEKLLVVQRHQGDRQLQ